MRSQCIVPLGLCIQSKDMEGGSCDGRTVRVHKKAVVTLRELSEDEKIRLQCEARERYQMDWQS